MTNLVNRRRTRFGGHLGGRIPRVVLAGIAVAALAASSPAADAARTHQSSAVRTDHHISATSHPGARAAASRTIVSLRVKTCRHCPVYLQQALTDGTYWKSPVHHVRGGRATFTVATRRTHGMSFVLDPRWANVTDAVTNVVTRYAGMSPGQRISNAKAAHEKRGTACWAGTSSHRVSLVVRAVKFKAKALGGGPGHALRAWFNPMTTGTAPLMRTWRGTLGNQDAYYCSAS